MAPAARQARPAGLAGAPLLLPLGVKFVCSFILYFTLQLIIFVVLFVFVLITYFRLIFFIVYFIVLCRCCLLSQLWLLQFLLWVCLGVRLLHVFPTCESKVACTFSKNSSKQRSHSLGSMKFGIYAKNDADFLGKN